MAHTTLSRGDVTLHYRDWGSGKNVVLVHGDNIDAHYWQYQISVLGANGCRVVAPDRRGHGRSSYTSGGFDLDTYAADLDALLTELEIRGAVLVGHSTGASSIVRYLTRYGATRVDGIVLAALAKIRTLAHDDLIARAALEHGWEATLADRPTYFQSLTGPFFGPKGSPAVMNAFVDLCLQLPLEIALAEGRFLLNPRNDILDELKDVPVPALILHGDSDTFAPLAESGQLAFDAIPDSRLVLYEGASHAVTMTEQYAVTREILDFIQALKRPMTIA